MSGSTPPRNPQNQQAPAGTQSARAAPAAAGEQDHSLDRMHEHLTGICTRLDGLRQRLGGTGASRPASAGAQLGNDDMAELNAVVTELQSLAGLPNAAVDPDVPSGTADPEEANRPRPQDPPDKRK